MRVLDVEALRDLQLDRLRETVRRVYSGSRITDRAKRIDDRR